MPTFLLRCSHNLAPRGSPSNTGKTARNDPEGKILDKEREENLLAGDLNAFAWTYSQKTGELQQDGKHVATSYSGAGSGKNNPEMENVHNVGPLPQGDSTIVAPPVNTSEHGPCVLTLKPSADTPTFGRDGFLLHGDSKESPGGASHGCVIMPRSVREQVWKSGDRNLEVVAEIPTQDPAEGRSK